LARGQRIWPAARCRHRSDGGKAIAELDSLQRAGCQNGCQKNVLEAFHRGLLFSLFAARKVSLRAVFLAFDVGLAAGAFLTGVCLLHILFNR
jgi:hypothetical protein